MNKKKPIRVLQNIGMVCGGGVEAVIMNYYRNINKQNVQFDFIVDGKGLDSFDNELKKLGGKVYHVTPYKENIVRYMRDIYKIIKDNNYIIFHDNLNTMAGFSLFSAWLAGVKIRILHNHSTNSKEEFKRYYMKLLLRPFAPIFANKYLACSKLAGEWMFGSEKVQLGNVRIVNNAIDLQKFSFSEEVRAKLRSEINVNDEDTVIGHIGRMVPQKNHMFLLELFAEFYRKQKNSWLLLIGDGPLRESIIAKARDLRIYDRIIFLGVRSDVNKYYSVMDLFLLPSLYEGLPVVTVEAQANGVPILMSDEITSEAIVRDNVCQLSLNLTKDVWVDEMNKFVGMRSSRDLTSLEKAGFSIQKEAEKLEIYYRNLVQGVENSGS